MGFLQKGTASHWPEGLSYSSCSGRFYYPFAIVAKGVQTNLNQPRDVCHGKKEEEGKISDAKASGMRYGLNAIDQLRLKPEEMGELIGAFLSICNVCLWVGVTDDKGAIEVPENHGTRDHLFPLGERDLVALSGIMAILTCFDNEWIYFVPFSAMGEYFVFQDADKLSRASIVNASAKPACFPILSNHDGSAFLFNGRLFFFTFSRFFFCHFTELVWLNNDCAGNFHNMISQFAMF